MLEAARNYASEWAKPIPITQEGIPEASSPELEEFDKALGRLVVASNERALLNPDKDREVALRWVPYARWALRECARKGEIPAGLERTRLFSESCVDVQQELYEEVVAGRSES